MEKQKFVIIGLSIALFLTIQYFLLNDWLELTEQRIEEGFQFGYEQGLIDGVSQIIIETQNCQFATISVNNLTRQVIDINCVLQTEESP